MVSNMWTVFLLTLSYMEYGISEFMDCHMDPSYNPSDGMMEDVEFKWLAALQYIHLKKGTPHYYRVPRVVLITRNFVVATSKDAAMVPDGYALGNVVFPDYERDEDECDIAHVRYTDGLCAPGILFVPIEDVLLHPKMDTRNSVALLKLLIPVKSKYVIPICLPLVPYTAKSNQTSAVAERTYYHVDFMRAAPRQFLDEDKEITFLHMLNKDTCQKKLHVLNESVVHDRVACSVECGQISGSPTVVHERTGHWTVVALAQGSAPCNDPFITYDSEKAATHLLIYPYLGWISKSITGAELTDFDEEDPFGFLSKSVSSKKERLPNNGWVGRWWMAGVRCYDRGTIANSLFRIYHESFQVRGKSLNNVTYYLEIEAVNKALVVCVKVGVGHFAGTPHVWGLDTSSIKLWLPVRGITKTYRFEVEAWARNNTELD